jgi:hypothetical protein
LGQALKLSAERILKHLFIQTQIGDHFPQLGVLVLELLQPPEFRPRLA